MAKCGRKKKLDCDLRKHTITCRLTDSELEMLNHGKPSGMTRGEWIRTKALKRKLPKAIPSLNQKAWSDLGRSLGIFTRLVNFLIKNRHEFESKETMAEIKNIRTEIKNIRKQLIGLLKDES